MRKWPRWRDKTRLRRSFGAHGRWMCHFLDVNFVSKDRVTELLPKKLNECPLKINGFTSDVWILLSPSPFSYETTFVSFPGVFPEI